LAQRGHQVLAMDIDTMPGLAHSIGLAQTDMSNDGIPETYGERQEEVGWVLKDGVDVAELVNQYARPAPDGIRFLQLGKLPHRVKPGSTAAFRAILNQYRADGWSMVGDLAAGTRQPFFGWSNFAQIILIVVEPSAKSVLSAHRLARLVNRPLPEGEQPQKFAIIANKIRDESDLVELRQLLAETAVRNVPILSTIPYDKEAETAEQEGLAAIDSAPKSAVVQAIRELAVKLEKEIASSNYLVVQSV
jgi:CO dehydrogenase maturation factor